MYDKPKNQEFHVAGIQHIDPADAWKMLQDNKAVLLDVRENFELNQESLVIPEESVLHIPMLNLVDRIEEVPGDKTILVVCAIGERSAKVVNLLKFQGFPNAFNVDGGLKACRSCGLPFIGAASCDCSSCDCGCC